MPRKIDLEEMYNIKKAIDTSRIALRGDKYMDLVGQAITKTNAKKNLAGT